MLKFRPSNLTQKRASISFNELQLIALIEKGLSDNSLRGFLYKRSSANSKWRLKWFLLFENLLFYFDVGQQQQQQPVTGGSSSNQLIWAGRSPSRSLSSLIRRNKNPQANSKHQQAASRQLPTTDASCNPAAEPQRDGSHNELLINDTTTVQVVTASPTTTVDHEISAVRRASLGENAAQSPSHNLLPGGKRGLESGSAGCRRQRLCSDPQAASTINSSYHRIPASASQAQVYANHELQSAASTTQNSSSISGISGHFQAHNEQTIGRSTTTTAGKTPASSSSPMTGHNYASLLNRKIGVIFLEGSYCERLCDSAPTFTPSTASHSSPNVVPEMFCGKSGEQLGIASSYMNNRDEDGLELTCLFTLKWKKEGSKEYQFRSETESECQTWVHAISNARYSILLNDKEQLEQKYLHLSQIIESESTAKWHYSRQCEEFLVEIKKLKQEICLLKRQESRSNQLRLVLSRSAAVVETFMREQRRRQRQRLRQQPQPQPQSQQPSELPVSPSSLARPANSPASNPPALNTPNQFVGGAASSQSRTRSLDQEQEEQENAVRRISRLTQQTSMSATENQCPTSEPRHKRLSQFSGEQLTLQMVRRHSDALRALVQSVAGGMEKQAGSSERLGTGNGSAASEDEADQEETEAGEVDGDAEADDVEAELSVELKSVVEALNEGFLLSDCLLEVENSEELRKIKKVQGFFRGWLCRRRWKQIVQEYIKSPHAESMRKRNNLVFRMVECEEEYVDQLTLLISAFLRPIKMAASSQRPALDHDELNSIFLNSETLLFLHQIFLKGLMARMESWPTLVLGDLFNMLLPMLTIYQEYVRNHHFSLQVLAECKQRDQFSLILRRLEEKPQLNGRTLETFLTYPMHQIPRYIICLHEILAHTPHNHVERKSLYQAQTKLEELSRQMHDEVSETENIRQNLAIERMIIGGCDILLDVNQVFVRQGILLQVIKLAGKSSKNRSRLAPFTSRQTNRQQQHQDEQQQQQHQHQHHLQSGTDFSSTLQGAESAFGSQTSTQHHHANYCDNPAKESIRQCFLFTNHLLLCTRTKDGKLHLLEDIGRISLSEVTLIENPLEFIQQQETIIANFDSILRQQHQQESNPTSCSVQNYTDGAQNGTHKRASTASAPANVKSSGLDQVIKNSQLNSRTSASERPGGSSVNASEAVGSPGPSQLPPTSRGRIAGYFATKLSSLANLGVTGNYGTMGTGKLLSGSSSSAPASPLNKRRPQQNQQCQQQHSNSTSAKKNSSHLMQPLWLSKDYGGCDFVLLIESAALERAYKGGGGSSFQASSSLSQACQSGALAIHLVAPNLQEKAAWMSDISQVSLCLLVLLVSETIYLRDKVFLAHKDENFVLFTWSV